MINLNKTDWIEVNLQDLIIKKEENDKKNAKINFDRFVKVEHMEAENLNLNYWSSQKLGDIINPYFYKIFRKGQILFPTRNPHLKRAVIAPFDGICGEKTLTLEILKAKVEPDFLSFVFHSESFYRHTRNAIIGSTNPHVRWRDVKNFKFYLPPIELQKKFSKLLLYIDNLEKEYISLLEKFKNFDESNLKKIFDFPKTKKKTKLLNIINTKKGIKPKKISNDLKNLPYCSTKYLRNDIVETTVEKKHLNGLVQIDENDIVILWDGAAGEIFKGKKGILSSTMSKVNIKNELYLPSYIFEFLRNSSEKINYTSVGSVIKHVDPNFFFNLSVPEISIDEQKKIILFCDQIRSNIKKLQKLVKITKQLKRALINKVF